ncbi:MAG: phosphatase PAP2 family protein [Clostridia bacterium]|nr:phosphatase PAP2 family protein [Clostridia bacterium]
MYDSLINMSITVLLVGMGLLWVATGKEPWKVLWFTMKDLFTDHPFRMTFLLMIAVLMVNKLELVIERELMGSLVTWDITPYIHFLEGNVGSLFQAWAAPWTTEIFTFIYVFVYPAVIGASLIGYNFNRDSVLVRTLFYAFVLNYLFALPFYLFFPVKEAWTHNQDIKLLIDTVYPAYHTQYRLVSGLDNSFPSLHTSVSVTMALLAGISGRRVWAWLVGIFALLTVFSTLYLGIHWVSDVVAGVGLAVTSFLLARVLVEKDYRILAAKKSFASWVRNLPFF